MKKLIFCGFAVLLLTLISVSCSRDHEDPTVAGSWSGTYEGQDDEGTWIATITEDRVFAGTTTSTKMTLKQNIHGLVDGEGNLNATSSVGTLFTGKVEKNKKASGTWKFGSSQGTWKGSKK